MNLPYLLAIAYEIKLLRVLRRFASQNVSLCRYKLEEFPGLPECGDRQGEERFVKSDAMLYFLGFWWLPWSERIKLNKLRIFNPNENSHVFLSVSGG